MKRLFFLTIAVLLFPVGIWWFLISEDLLLHSIESSLAPYQLHADFLHLRKGPFYQVQSQSISLKRSDQPLFSIDDFVGRINPLLLFLMRPNLSFRGVVAGGHIAGEVSQPYMRGARGQIRFDRLSLDGIPFLAEKGIAGGGVITGEGRLDDHRGELTFSIQGLHLKNGSSWGAVIPLDLFDRGRGILCMEEEKIRIGSFSLEGDGIFARIKGTIGGGETDLTIEIMPDAHLLEEGSSRLSLLEKFKVSPGYYVIPIRGHFP
ncbi:MAG: type II secretion system protein GspN, partial [candidate division NC10 bacterium]|nr:type II secretion system protein GspN [candidate division NC10 bacterium]